MPGSGKTLRRACSGHSTILTKSRARLIAGQAYVAERFAPARIAGKWAEVLGLLSVERARSSP